MGNGSSAKLPPISDVDMRTVLSYNLKEDHLKHFLRAFRDMDIHFVGAWGVQEMYALISEPRLSLRAPIIDALFFMGDSGGEGSLQFQDFLVLMASFCALTREEVLQLLFIILDRDRNGKVSKNELAAFFSYVPLGSGGERAPVFPVNNKNSLDKFRKGKWQHLHFDGFSRLCQHFPYISYPAYHTQELYRHALLGKKFWERFCLERAKGSVAWKPRWVTLPGTSGKEQVEVHIPGRVALQEMIELSRRTTSVVLGKRVASRNTMAKSKFTMQRDLEVARCPIFAMIRNPRCMYHIPRDVEAGPPSDAKPASKRLSNFELPASDAGGGVLARASSMPVGMNLGDLAQDEQEEEASESSSSGSWETDDEEDGGEEPLPRSSAPRLSLPAPP